MATSTGPGDARRRQDQRRRAGGIAFARDVLVNLVANILAAAILYLVARATGYVRGNDRLTVVAIGVVVAGLNVAFIYAAMTWFPPRARTRWSTAAFATLLLASFGVAYGGGQLNRAINPGVPAQELYNDAASSLQAVFLGVLVLVTQREWLFPDRRPARSLAVLAAFVVLIAAGAASFIIRVLH